MGKIDFNSNSEPTLGIELELGLVDADTMALSNSVGPLLARLPVDSAGCFKPELMQSCLEVNTCVCHTVAEAERDLRDKLAVIVVDGALHFGFGGITQWLKRGSLHLLGGRGDERHSLTGFAKSFGHIEVRSEDTHTPQLTGR